MCEHYGLSAEHHFLPSLTAKLQWICLYDGCTRIKKNISKEELTSLCNKYTIEHRVMLNCETFEIYCTECQREILDFSLEELQQSSKSKKLKKMDPFAVRQLMVSSNQTEDILFAGNAEYPPSFQREKQGLCGLKMNSVSSYLNSMLQLLAAVPIIADMCSLTDVGKLDNRFMKLLVGTITTIWSGKYRIHNCDELQRELIQEDANFKSYRHKTPQHLFYFIVKKLMDEFLYLESPCSPGEIMTSSFEEWRPSQSFRYYTFTREFLGGECVLESTCGTCGKVQYVSHRFECLKISYERQQYHSQNQQIDIYHLIEESFNWRNNHFQIIKKIEEGKLQCEQCSEKVKVYLAYVRLPNHLVLEFGDDAEGLNTTLPEEIDLLKFSEDYIKKQPSSRAVYQYVGSIYRKEKRYHSHIKHSLTKKEYNICDQVIAQGERTGEQIKFAIYKRIPNPKNQPLLRNIISSFEVNVNPIVPLPDYWSLYLKYNHSVQPLANPFICTHGRLKNNLSSSKLKEGPQRLPVEIYQYLLETFGGRQIASNPQQLCHLCQEVQEKIAEIRNSEKEIAIFADKLSHKKERVLINRAWLQSWKQFVYGSSRKDYRTFGHPRPGPINNSVSNIQVDLANDQLKKISPEVWFFLQKFYEGGPLICKTEVHPNAVVKSAVTLRFEAIHHLISDLYGPPRKAPPLESPQLSNVPPPDPLELSQQQHLSLSQPQ